MPIKEKGFYLLNTTIPNKIVFYNREKIDNKYILHNSDETTFLIIINGFTDKSSRYISNPTKEIARLHDLADWMENQLEEIVNAQSQPSCTEDENSRRFRELSPRVILTPESEKGQEKFIDGMDYGNDDEGPNGRLWRH